jgi:hypothetical protein
MGSASDSAPEGVVVAVGEETPPLAPEEVAGGVLPPPASPAKGVVGDRLMGFETAPATEEAIASAMDDWADDVSILVLVIKGEANCPNAFRQ